MDHISLRLRSFKLHLTIPMERRARLPKTITLTYLPRVNKTPLEINTVNIPPNLPVSIVLRRVRSAGFVDELEVVYASKDRVYIGDGYDFEIYICEQKAFKGVFRRAKRWGLKCEVINCTIWAEVRVVTDEGFLIKEKVKLVKTRFLSRLPTIQEDEEKDLSAEMKRSNEEVHVKNLEKDDSDGVVNKGIGWAVNVGIFVACLGVGLFASRASFKRVMGYIWCKKI